MIPLHDDNPTERFPWLTVLIIAANAGVFFFWQMGQEGLERSVQLAAFVPSELGRGLVMERGHTLITSMFMHGGIMHLVGNMWFLWLFGNNVEDRCGHFRFLIFYLLCGLAGTLGYAAFNLQSQIPLVGASGAISGILGGYLVLYPHARVLTLVPMGMFSRTTYLPAWMFLIIWIGFQMLNQMMVAVGPGQGGGVAFLAHIAGFVAGIILIFVFRKGRKKSFQ